MHHFTREKAHRVDDIKAAAGVLQGV